MVISTNQLLTSEEITNLAAAFHYFQWPQIKDLPENQAFTQNYFLNEAVCAIKYAKQQNYTSEQIDIFYAKICMYRSEIFWKAKYDRAVEAHDRSLAILATAKTHTCCTHFAPI